MESVKQIIFTKRNILVLVAVVLVAEAVWAYQTLSKPSSQAPVVSEANPTVSPSVLASASLQASKTLVKTGEKVTVTLNLSSAAPTDGTDLIVIYDPKFLEVDPENKKAPVNVGTVYSEYPINNVDEKTGRIAVSGITSTPGGVIPKGAFGVITFVAKTAGKTKVSLDFTPGSTSDSNIVETKSAKDILGEVKNIDLTITP